MKKLIILLIAFFTMTVCHASYPSTNTEWFTAYKKNYFSTGFSNDPFGNQGKFQISVKSKFLTEDIYNTNLYFAYTQQSFYDFRSSQDTGRPVYESSYIPEVFIRKTLTNKENPLKYIDIGFRHHSNGQGDVLISENRLPATGESFNINQIDRNWLRHHW